VSVTVAFVHGLELGQGTLRFTCSPVRVGSSRRPGSAQTSATNARRLKIECGAPVGDDSTKWFKLRAVCVSSSVVNSTSLHPHSKPGGLDGRPRDGSRAPLLAVRPGGGGGRSRRRGAQVEVTSVGEPVPERSGSVSASHTSSRGAAERSHCESLQLRSASRNIGATSGLREYCNLRVAHYLREVAGVGGWVGRWSRQDGRAGTLVRPSTRPAPRSAIVSWAREVTTRSRPGRAQLLHLEGEKDPGAKSSFPVNSPGGSRTRGCDLRRDAVRAVGFVRRVCLGSGEDERGAMILCGGAAVSASRCPNAEI